MKNSGLQQLAQMYPWPNEKPEVPENLHGWCGAPQQNMFGQIVRCPSEAIALKWSDVEWKKNRFFVRSPKTEHHDGKESRIVPLFPELKTELETLFFMPGSDGKEFVINRHRDSDRNLGAPFNKISKEAGLAIIPRPFDNMRATRSNEIYARFGPTKESEWIGHSAKVRENHYDMITDDDFESAANWEISCTEIADEKFSHPLSHPQGAKTC